MIRTYDAWKASGPHEDLPSALPKMETCEHCGGAVSAIETSWCDACHRYSWRRRRPEHEGEGPS